MHIFASENNIKDKIESNTSIAYTAQIDKSETDTFAKKGYTDLQTSDLDEVVSASLKDNELYYHTAILVTTNWNKNDDIFLPPVVWAAKDTPVHKPTNLGHDSTKIIGHMTSSWAIDQEGKIIEAGEDYTELPNKFHILVGSVIYKVWPSSDEYEENIEALLKEIEAGNKYVSMECTFKNFDYALQNDKELTIVARNEDTAFLSKYLRAYGGEGIYKDFKIGRVVRNISFCGKGYVDKPANPESVIFTKDEIFDFAVAKNIEKIEHLKENGVISDNHVTFSLEKSNMTDFYKEQADELKVQNKALAESVDELKEKLTQSNVTKLEKDIEKLTAQTNDMSEVLTKKSESLTAKEAELVEVNKKVTDLTKANEELIKSHKELTDKMAVIEAERKANARIATLVGGGFTKEEADVKVQVFTALADDQFELVAKEIIEAKKYTKNPENPGDAKAEDLDTAKVIDEKVISASDQSNEFDVTELAGKLSAELRTKDGDK